MSAVRRHKDVVKASHERDLAVHDAVFKQTEQFLGKKIFFHSEMIVQTGLRTPADMEGGEYMCFGPFHDLTEFLPIVNLLEGKVFHGSTGDDHTVIFILFQFIKRIVEPVQMVRRCVQRDMAVHFHKSDVNLKRCVGQCTEKLQFCILFDGHQIQDTDLKRTDRLMDRPVFVHHKYIFILKNFLCGKIVLYFNRHNA